MKDFPLPLLGYSVSASLYEPDQPKDHVLLSLIGFTSNRQRYKEFLSNIAAEVGITSLVFDYSGHGDSPFEVEDISPAEHFIEVIAAFDWLRAQYPSHKITVMGSSYGGYMAALLTQYRTFDNLILRAPAIYPPHTYHTKWRELEQNRHQLDYRSNTEALATHPLFNHSHEFSGNSLVLVHELDDVIPTQTTDAYINSFGADRYLAKGFPHGLAETSEEMRQDYMRYVTEWLKDKGV